MVDVRRTPEVTTGWDVTKLHHPAGTPDVVRLFRTIVVRDVVLAEVRCHTVQERDRVVLWVVVQHFNQCEIECIHFESTPLTSIESAQKVIDLTEKMAVFAPKNKIKLYMVPFEKMHQALLNNVPESYNITIMRRMMYRIAERIAEQNNDLICLIIDL